MPNYAYDHVHLISSDPVKAAEFYEKAFGAKRTNISTHADGAISVMLSLLEPNFLSKVRGPAIRGLFWIHHRNTLGLNTGA